MRMRHGGGGLSGSVARLSSAGSASQLRSIDRRGDSSAENR